METKFILWSKTIWGMVGVNGLIVAWNAWPGQPHPVNQDTMAAINMVVAFVLRLITTQPVTMVPVKHVS